LIEQWNPVENHVRHGRRLAVDDRRPWSSLESVPRRS
jgi:hypothetical protein